MTTIIHKDQLNLKLYIPIIKKELLSNKNESAEKESAVAVESKFLVEENKRTAKAHLLSLSSGILAGMGIFILATSNPIGIGIGIALLTVGAISLFAACFTGGMQNPRDLPSLILTGITGIFFGFMIVTAIPILMNKIILSAAMVLRGAIDLSNLKQVSSRITSIDHVNHEMKEIRLELKYLVYKKKENKSDDFSDEFTSLQDRVTDLFNYRKQQLKSEINALKKTHVNFDDFITGINSKRNSQEILEKLDFKPEPEFIAFQNKLVQLKNLIDLAEKIYNSNNYTERD